MSRRESGCLSFIFGSCYRNKNRSRYTVSIENSDIRIQHSSTQTILNEQTFRSSAPANLFTQHKPTIAVRANHGFRVQQFIEKSATNVSANKENIGCSLLNSQDIDSIYRVGTENSDPILSAKTIESLFPRISPKNEAGLPNPFVWNQKQDRPKLMPITPDQFSKRKLVPSTRNNLKEEKRNFDV